MPNLPSVCPVTIKFKPSFLTMCPRTDKCVFLILIMRPFSFLFPLNFLFDQMFCPWYSRHLCCLKLTLHLIESCPAFTIKLEDLYYISVLCLVLRNIFVSFLKLCLVVKEFFFLTKWPTDSVT